MAPFPDLTDLPEPPERSALVNLSVMDLLGSMRGQEPIVVPLRPDHEARTASATQSMDQRMADLVDAMHRSLVLNQEARDAAARTEVFTRRMSHASLWVSIVSLLAALGSLGVAVLALNITGH